MINGTIKTMNWMYGSTKSTKDLWALNVIKNVKWIRPFFSYETVLRIGGKRVTDIILQTEYDNLLGKFPNCISYKINK